MEFSFFMGQFGFGFLETCKEELLNHFEFRSVALFV
jgi:hypothetical protein